MVKCTRNVNITVDITDLLPVSFADYHWIDPISSEKKMRQQLIEKGNIFGSCNRSKRKYSRFGDRGCKSECHFIVSIKLFTSSPLKIL